MSRLLQGLNPQQLEAVETTDGPLLVIAGAGSGKTRVLTRRLAYILTERLAEPYQMLAVTFTNKAAGEMRERVAQLLGGEIPSLQVSTFHSFCARFLRKEAVLLGYSDNFTIFDTADSETLIKNCIKELGFSTTQFPHKGQLSKISRAKNKLVSPDEFESASSGYFETTSAKIYQMYQKRLLACNAMDFDDLLVNTVRILREFEDVGARYSRRFHYVLVDEYQDTNHVQYKLLRLLASGHGNICVVGDEDQSIYGWRGADISNILNFEKDFSGAKTIKLEQNYRSTSVILSAASAVIKNNAARKEKTLWTEESGGDPINQLLVDSAEEEANEIVRLIDLARVEYGLKEQVILYRTNAQSRAFEEKLRRENIPYQLIGGVSFYQRKEIKDLMAYLKLLANIKDDVSLQRIINYPKRGIGNKTVADLQLLASSQGGSIYELLLQLDERPELARLGGKLRPFVELIESLRSELETAPVDLLTEKLIEQINLIAELRNEDEVQG
jgi:DNA helicase-2/ATP-dependent DNA helicase PcrA